MLIASASIWLSLMCSGIPAISIFLDSLLISSCLSTIYLFFSSIVVIKNNPFWQLQQLHLVLNSLMVQLDQME